MIKKYYFIILVAFVILLTGAGAAAGYYFWKGLGEQNKSLDKQNKLLVEENKRQSQEQQQVQQIQQDIQTKVDSLANQISQQASQLETFQSQLSQMISSEKQIVSEENLNEIAYLLDLANLYLQINRDPATAIKSLQLAQYHEQQLNNPQLLPLQQALASDINRLNEVKQVDTAGLLLELQILSESISRLSLIPSPLSSPSTPEQTPQRHWWDKAWGSFWQNFKNLFAIRYHGQNQSTLLPPQQREWVQENIAFTLSQAQWAVLQKKSELYQHSLNQVQQWLQNYYPDSPQRQQVISRLSALASTDIAPNLPSIDSSLRAVQQALQVRASNREPQQTSPPSSLPPANSSGTLAPRVSPGIEI